MVYCGEKVLYLHHIKLATSELSAYLYQKILIKVKSEFLCYISEHQLFGYKINACFAERGSKHFFTIVENVRKGATELTNEQIEFVNLLEEISDNGIQKAFDKKKTNVKSFFAFLDKNYITEFIKPYIEKRLVKLIQLIKIHQFPLFFRHDKSNQLYETDTVSITDSTPEIVFKFIKKEDGLLYNQSILLNGDKISLYKKFGIVLVSKPCYLLLEDNIYYFEDIDGAKLNPFFKNEFIHVPLRLETEYFRKFVKDVVRKFKVEATGFEIVDEDYHPLKVLSLEYDLKQEISLVPKFVYGTKSFLLNDKQPTIVDLDETKNFTFYRLQRNLILEKKAIQSLLVLGLKIENESFLKLPAIDNIINSKGNRIVQWLNFQADTLRELGFEIVQNLQTATYNLNKIELQFQTNQRIDWFDIYGLVKIGNIEIPFLKLKDNILNDIPEYKLPTGEIIVIPDEWFARYQPMFLFSKEDSDMISISKNSIHIVDDSLQSNGLKMNEILQHANHSTNEPIPLPDGLQAELRPYQKDGYNWLWYHQTRKTGAILADDMGLGKTLQTISLLLKIKFDALLNTPTEKNAVTEMFGNKIATTLPPSLIVMPTSLIYNWIAEFKRFAPDLRIGIYVGLNRKEILANARMYDVILSTYRIITNDIELLEKNQFHYLILDESQYIKNSTSKSFLAICKLKSVNRLSLTGTPLENNLLELWAQFNFINPGMLGNEKFYISKFLLPITKSQNDNRANVLRKMIQPFILRRKKEEVLTDLPDKIEQVVYCEMTEEQKALYETEKSEIRNQILEEMEEGKKSPNLHIVFQKLTRLRQLSSHPKLYVKDYEGESGKFNQICDSIEELVSENHKILVFSSFVEHLNLIAEHLNSQSILFEMLTGKTENREKVITNFLKNEKIKIFLISIKAGGVGINLTEADYVFIIDPWWNPAIESQAIARAHRIGQKNTVMVQRFCSLDTIEEKILLLQKKKQEMYNFFVDGNSESQTLSAEDLLELLS